MVVVVLGGTGEARQLAQQLERAGIEVWTTLAGRTTTPEFVAGRIHTGGFGGVDEMVAWLDGIQAEAIVDATHPFADQMTTRALAVADRTGLPVVRLQRLGWETHPDASRWQWVDGHGQACAAAAMAYDRLCDTARKGSVLLAIGRQELDRYRELGATPTVARVAEHPRSVGRPGSGGPVEQGGPVGPPGQAGRAEMGSPLWESDMEVVCQRGPFTVEAEREFFDQYQVRVVVSKNSGGQATRAKLDVAAERRLPVVMVRRPPLPPGLPQVGTALEAAAWVKALRTGRRPG